MDAETGRVNPYKDRGRWYWRDEEQTSWGPYDTQVLALQDLLRHCDKRTRWPRFFDNLATLVRELARA